MGAKQSKRSVDISGKEAESAGEVAVAGAGGEGRMEQLADADALKPQANGDAHTHDTPEKEIETAGTELEKDATTEKEMKDQEENQKEKETVVTIGEDEQKAENGESTPSTDDGKKNKKEKVKKKWSLRSISFSRKDKPKQEKKLKDIEAKTNGQPENFLGEALETPEIAENEMNVETKCETEIKDEKTPDTPVTEPLTNGSSTPESPKIGTNIVEELKNETASDTRPEPKVEIVASEPLSINNVSLEEDKKDKPELPAIDSNKTEEAKVETTESVPTPECPIIKEVCVDQKPLIEPTPPPLPANPPPSSVASFAATTMAPELTESALANNADNYESAHADVTPVSIENTNRIPTQIPIETVKDNDEPETIKDPSPSNEIQQAEVVNAFDNCYTNDHEVSPNTVEENVSDVLTDTTPTENKNEVVIEPEPKIIKTSTLLENSLESSETVEEIGTDPTIATPEDMSKETSNSELSKTEQDSGICELKEMDVDLSIISQYGLTAQNSSDEAIVTECSNLKAKETIENAEVSVLNGDAVCGDRSPDDHPPEIEEEESFPLPPSDLCCTDSEMAPEQEPLPIADKMAELIPEVPTIPELNTDLEMATDVVVAN